MSFTKTAFLLFPHLYNEALLPIQKREITFSSLKQSSDSIHFFILPWGEYRRIFRKKWNSMKINKNYMNILSFSSWFWISYFCTTKHWFLATKRDQEVLKCHKIRHFEKYALVPFDRANIFFVISLYHFVAL